MSLKIKILLKGQAAVSVTGYTAACFFTRVMVRLARKVIFFGKSQVKSLQKKKVFGKTFFFDMNLLKFKKFLDFDFMKI